MSDVRKPAPQQPAPQQPAPQELVTEEPAPQATQSPSSKSAQTSCAKLVIEMAPLVVFFGAYAIYGLKTATGVLMVASLVSLVAAWKWLGHVSSMLIVTAGLVCFFGVLTFALDDPSFIKMKPTAVNLIFAGVLGFGLATGRQFLKHVLGEALQLSDTGWTKLTARWIGFFIVMAAANEFIWRTMSDSAWVNFKVFGILPLTILFTIAQMGLIQRYALAKTPE
jgi:intracellular septation protein